MDKVTGLYLYETVPVGPEMPGRCFLYFKDDKGRDWYDLRDSWTGAALGVCPKTQMVQAFELVPRIWTTVEGQTVYEIDPDTVPENVVGRYTYDGKEFKLIEAPKRDKSDILADLDRLRAELLKMED